MVTGKARERIDLNNRITIEVHSASFRTTRGYSIVAALCDEICFWATNEFSSEPDTEVLNALRPGMSNVPGSMLLCASSPYARRGALWNIYKKHFAKEGDPVLVWQAATKTMNRRIPQRVVDAAMEEDPAHAQAEFYAQWRSDLEAFIDRDTVEACIPERGLKERPPEAGIIYTAGCDMSGGSADSAALTICHYDKSRDVVVIDCTRERKGPHSPESAAEEFSTVLKSYNTHKVFGDHYGGQYPIEQYAKFNITYEPSDKTKSAAYVDFLPLLNSCRVELLDDERTDRPRRSTHRRRACGADRRRSTWLTSFQSEAAMLGL